MFGSMEVDGHVVLQNDGYAHFVSDDGKFQMLVHRDAIEVTALPELRASGRYDVFVPASTQIKALRHGQQADEWVPIGNLTKEGFKTMTYNGQLLRFVDETRVANMWQDPHA